MFHIAKNNLEISLQVFVTMDRQYLDKIVNNIRQSINIREVHFIPTQDPINHYYKDFRFGIKLKGMEYPIVDGGSVDWMEQLLQNKKQRLVISGLGTDLLERIKSK